MSGKVLKYFCSGGMVTIVRLLRFKAKTLGIFMLSLVLGCKQQLLKKKVTTKNNGRNCDQLDCKHREQNEDKIYANATAPLPES